MLNYVGNSTPCPICQAKIPSSAIEIIDTSDSHCGIHFSCDICKEDFTGQIQMKKIPMTEINKKLNVSTVLQNEPVPNEEISKNEVQAMHNALEKDVSFADLFGESAGKLNKKIV